MVYLIHFSEPYPRGNRTPIQHYLGFARDAQTFPRRLEHHRRGTGARLMAAVARAGLTFEVARTWDSGTRTDERKLKNRKNAPRLCPLCQQQLRQQQQPRKRAA